MAPCFIALMIKCPCCWSHGSASSKPYRATHVTTLLYSEQTPRFELQIGNIGQLLLTISIASRWDLRCKRSIHCSGLGRGCAVCVEMETGHGTRRHAQLYLPGIDVTPRQAAQSTLRRHRQRAEAPGESERGAAARRRTVRRVLPRLRLSPVAAQGTRLEPISLVNERRKTEREMYAIMKVWQVNCPSNTPANMATGYRAHHQLEPLPEHIGLNQLGSPQETRHFVSPATDYSEPGRRSSPAVETKPLVKTSRSVPELSVVGSSNKPRISEQTLAWTGAADNDVIKTRSWRSDKATSRILVPVGEVASPVKPPQSADAEDSWMLLPSQGSTPRVSWPGVNSIHYSDEKRLTGRLQPLQHPRQLLDYRGNSVRLLTNVQRMYVRPKQQPLLQSKNGVFPRVDPVREEKERLRRRRLKQTAKAMQRALHTHNKPPWYRREQKESHRSNIPPFSHRE